MALALPSTRVHEEALLDMTRTRSTHAARIVCWRRVTGVFVLVISALLPSFAEAQIRQGLGAGAAHAAALVSRTHEPVQHHLEQRAGRHLLADGPGHRRRRRHDDVRVAHGDGQPDARGRASAIFSASPDHDTLVTSYRLEIFVSGTDPHTATPVAAQNLGKRAVVNGEVTADITATINALSPGNYQATVSAVGSGGSARSSPASFTR